MDKRFRHSLLFLAISFAYTWLFYFLIVLFHWNPYSGPGAVCLFLGGCAPSVLGFTMAMVTYDKQDRRDYLRRLYRAKSFHPLWWAAALLLLPALLALSMGIDALLGGALPQMIELRSILANPVLFFPYVLLSFMSGPFSEEMGWRGFALDPLIDRLGLWRASIGLGLVWGLWHLPLYLIPETWHGKMGFALTGFWSFLALSVGLSMIMSVIYRNTNRSILIAMLVHLASNFPTQLIAGSAGPGYSPRIELIRSLLVLVVGVALCAWQTRRQRLQTDRGVLLDRQTARRAV